MKLSSHSLENKNLSILDAALLPSPLNHVYFPLSNCGTINSISWNEIRELHHGCWSSSTVSFFWRKTGDIKVTTDKLLTAPTSSYTCSLSIMQFGAYTPVIWHLKSSKSASNLQVKVYDPTSNTSRLQDILSHIITIPPLVPLACRQAYFTHLPPQISLTKSLISPSNFDSWSQTMSTFQLWITLHKSPFLPIVQTPNIPWYKFYLHCNNLPSLSLSLFPSSLNLTSKEANLLSSCTPLYLSLWWCFHSPFFLPVCSCLSAWVALMSLPHALESQFQTVSPI